LVTSISSIAIALHHGHVMEMLVQANSFPYMQGGFSDVTPDGKQVLSLDLLNRGVGPAHEESLRVKVGESYVRSVRELFAVSLGHERWAKAEGVLNPLRNQVRTRFIPGGQLQSVFGLTKTADNGQFWDLLAKDRERWDVQFCYCSVFQECWEVHSELQEPEHVKRYRRDESREFLP
jgi:hypothetical protein